MIYCAFDYPPDDGGIARLGAALCTQLACTGVPVTVLTKRHPQQMCDSRNATHEVAVSPRRVQREWQAYNWLRKHRSRGPVLCDIWYPEGALARLASVRPLVILAHGLELMPANAIWRRGIWYSLRKAICESADLIVTNSTYTRALVEKNAPAAKVATVPLGVDHRQFCPGAKALAKERFGVQGKLVISTVSRLHAYKGHSTVLRALASLPSNIRHRFAYMIAGKGPSEASLRNEASSLGITENVRWLGFVSERDLPQVYRASDAFVLCTRESHDRPEVEGFGLVFLEAQACGTPVIGTRTGGIPDAVKQDQGGWLIEQDDQKALADILALLASEPEHFRAQGLVARQRIENECTWSAYADRLITVLASHNIYL